MAKFAHIRFDQTDGIARLTLARPKHNVLSVEMMNEINTVLDALIADDEVKCLVIDAEGRSFCAGVDVGEHAPELAELTISTFGGIFERLDQLDIPVIAAVQGACLGGGMELAIACDIVCAGEAAVFGQPEVRLAFIPPYAAVRLPELVGPAKAIEICTTGRRPGWSIWRWGWAWPRRSCWRTRTPRPPPSTRRCASTSHSDTPRHGNWRRSKRRCHRLDAAGRSER